MFGFHTWRGGGGGAGRGVEERLPTRQRRAHTSWSFVRLSGWASFHLGGVFFFFFQHSWLKPPSSSYSQQRRIHLVSFLYMCVQSHTNDGWDQSCFGTKKKHFCALSAGLKAKSDRYGRWKQISWDMSDKHVQSKLYRLSSKETGRVKSRSNTFRSC